MEKLLLVDSNHDYNTMEMECANMIESKENHMSNGYDTYNFP